MPAAPVHAALLALAAQRLPGGGHVHSGGAEQAVAERIVTDATSLGRFLERRLRTAGLVAAGIAAAATRLAGSADAGAAMSRLDTETDARTPSPAQRAASRAQGRGLLRLATATWPAPSPELAWAALGPRPHHPVVLGCTAAAAGITPAGAALAAAYLAVTGPATAAQRLLALDPVSVAVVTLRLSAAIDATAAAAARAANRLHDLPDDSDPLLDLLAERHASRQERLFAS